MTDTTTTNTADSKTESRPFEADVSRLLHLMVHSVYSDKDVFLRELISNAADACERLRYDAIANPALLGDDAKSRITIAVDADQRELTLQENGIGLSHDELIDALGTIARSGTKAFMERLEAAKANESATLIGQFGIGFYSAFMVGDRGDVVSPRPRGVALRASRVVVDLGGAARALVDGDRRRAAGHRRDRGPPGDGQAEVIV